jgi:hypothetical protein
MAVKTWGLTQTGETVEGYFWLKTSCRERVVPALLTSAQLPTDRVTYFYGQSDDDTCSNPDEMFYVDVEIGLHGACNLSETVNITRKFSFLYNQA